MSVFENWAEPYYTFVHHELRGAARDIYRRAHRWYVLNERTLRVVGLEHMADSDQKLRAADLISRHFSELRRAERAFRRAWLRARSEFVPLPDYDDSDPPQDISVAFALFYTDSQPKGANREVRSREKDLPRSRAAEGTAGIVGGRREVLRRRGQCYRDSHR